MFLGCIQNAWPCHFCRNERTKNLKTDYRFIKFRVSTLSPNPDVRYVCFDKKRNVIGEVTYNNRFKEHEYAPFSGTAYTVECCTDIADFLRQLNRPPAGKE